MRPSVERNRIAKALTVPAAVLFASCGLVLQIAILMSGYWSQSIEPASLLEPPDPPARMQPAPAPPRKPHPIRPVTDPVPPQRVDPV